MKFMRILLLTLPLVSQPFWLNHAQAQIVSVDSVLNAAAAANNPSDAVMNAADPSKNVSVPATISANAAKNATDAAKNAPDAAKNASNSESAQPPVSKPAAKGELTPDPKQQVLVPPATGPAKTATQPPAISIQGILGADVSENQGTIDWPKLATDKKFVFIRATYGAANDAKFQENWKAARDNGVVRGAYHYFNPNRNIDDQIRVFVNSVHRLEKGDLPPVLDVESPGDWLRIPQKDRVPLVIKWLSGVESALGVKPILYMSPKFIEGTLGVQYSEPLRPYSAWLAHYEVSLPLVPQLWDKFLFWQYSKIGFCLGIIGHCDQDIFQGSVEDLLLQTLREPIEAPEILAVIHKPDPPALIQLRPWRPRPGVHSRYFGRGYPGVSRRSLAPRARFNGNWPSPGGHRQARCHQRRCR
jgi:lysozyme